MTRIFDEGFEGVGYEETWSIGETVGAGSTVDEDADTADVGSPSGWGDQCLKCITVGEEATNFHYPDTITDSWFHFHFILTAESLADSNIETIFFAWDNAFGIIIQIFIAQVSGELRLTIYWWPDGSTLNSDYVVIVLNTRYVVEFKWDTTNEQFEWRVDYETQATDDLEEGHRGGIGVFKLGLLGTGPGATIYYDLFAVDDADWIGVAPTGADPASTTMKLILGMGL